MTTEFPPAFARQYESHLKHLKLKGLQPKTIALKPAWLRGQLRQNGRFWAQTVELGRPFHRLRIT